jgi:hypothetical protein
LNVNKTASPATATRKVRLLKRATPSSISPKIINSTLTGPTDGTLPVDAEVARGIRNKEIKSKNFLKKIFTAFERLFII